MLESPKGAIVNSQGREPLEKLENVAESPEGATVNSVPDISFVPFQIVSSQELAEFVLKGNRAVMLLLIGQVRLYLSDVRLADSECAVSVLPLKFSKPQFVVNPSGRICFDESYRVGNCQGAA